jgi:hypothetical protein
MAACKDATKSTGLFTLSVLARLVLVEDEKRNANLAPAHLSSLAASAITSKSILKQNLTPMRQDSCSLHNAERENENEIARQHRSGMLHYANDAALIAQKTLNGDHTGT